jgi:hypothetical protein
VVDVDRRVGAGVVTLGHTLPRGSRPTTVRLDGRVVHHYRTSTTNRGVEVTVPTGPGHHTLEVTAA